MTFRADLHTHTNCSDGESSPTQLIRIAKQIGLSALSITDHDTIAAYPEAIKEAKIAGLLLGTGVEFSAAYEGMSVHLLGYDFDEENSGIHDFCAKHQVRRKERNEAILAKLSKRGMPIDPCELKGQGRPHIAALMVEKKYVASMQEAFHRYIGEGKLCYDSGHPFSVDETARVVRQAGGKVFLAHPHLMENRKLVRQLLNFPFDGMECYYAKCSPEQEKPWVKLAQSRGWLISGGSDFHGAAKPHIPLGCSWVDEKTFFSIFTRLGSHRVQ